uniref:CRIB domain-containing protein n=1 Tax=Globodera pallida TaxID=36090 RepID=A0A183CMI2_GLOPA
MDSGSNSSSSCSTPPSCSGGTRDKSSSKVRLRHILGRIFSGVNNNGSGSGAEDGGGGTAAQEQQKGWHPQKSINEISAPSDVVHRIHVGYDGQRFTGLPPSWLEMLDVSGLTEADQKKNPGAIVRALKFYAAAVKQRESDKFMCPQKSVYPASEDDIEPDDFLFTNGGIGIPNTMHNNNNSQQQCRHNSNKEEEMLSAKWYDDDGGDTDETASSIAQKGKAKVPTLDVPNSSGGQPTEECTELAVQKDLGLYHRNNASSSSTADGEEHTQKVADLLLEDEADQQQQQQSDQEQLVKEDEEENDQHRQQLGVEEGVVGIGCSCSGTRLEGGQSFVPIVPPRKTVPQQQQLLPNAPNQRCFTLQRQHLSPAGSAAAAPIVRRANSLDDEQQRGAVAAAAAALATAGAPAAMATAREMSPPLSGSSSSSSKKKATPPPIPPKPR